MVMMTFMSSCSVAAMTAVATASTVDSLVRLPSPHARVLTQALQEVHISSVPPSVPLLSLPAALPTLAAPATVTRTCERINRGTRRVWKGWGRQEGRGVGGEDDHVGQDWEE